MEYPNVEDGSANTVTLGFDDQSIRKGFIRKVCAILMCQLLVTMSFIALFIYCKPVKEWVFRDQWVLLGACIASLVIIVIMACSTEVRRKVPMNFIFLALFTVIESFLVGAACSFYEVHEVLMPVGITAAVCLALTLFAFQTKWDFTIFGGMLSAVLMVLFIFGIIALSIPNQIMKTLYVSLGALLFSFYLVYDTQLMMGGEHKYSISPEEYIFAALNLYLDIIILFLRILRIIAKEALC